MKIVRMASKWIKLRFAVNRDRNGGAIFYIVASSALFGNDLEIVMNGISVLLL